VRLETETDEYSSNLFQPILKSSTPEVVSIEYS